MIEEEAPKFRAEKETELAAETEAQTVELQPVNSPDTHLLLTLKTRLSWNSILLLKTIMLSLSHKPWNSGANSSKN